MLDPVTLDQLRMLVAIADTGSFTAAAKQVQRAQSAVSHAISVLEAQLELSLFDRSERKPRLTQAGHAVLSDARLAIARMDQLKRRAREIAGGLETELRVAVTVLAPLQAVVATLDQVQCGVPFRRRRTLHRGDWRLHPARHEGICQLGVSGSPSLRMIPDGQLTTIPIGSTDIIAVARPDHPLVLLNRALTQEDLNEHRQLVPTSRARAEYPMRSVVRSGGFRTSTLGAR
jgi:DNA-binding transcriptional LysR family regulator